MSKIVVIGAGWAGCAAAIRAVKRGHEVVLLEKTDLLLGLGNVGGIMRNNGRFTATEENIALGASELFAITDKLSTHRNVDFPGHEHASFYDVAMVEPAVRRLLTELGVDIRLMCRAVDVTTEDRMVAVGTETGGNATAGTAAEAAVVEGRKKRLKSITAVIINHDGEYESVEIEGDVFVETTGSTGPMGNCSKYGNGCSMCVLRCPAFGPRVSITERAGSYDVHGERLNGRPGAFSGSCKLEKRTLSPKLQKKLDKEGFVVVPLPPEMVNKDKLSQKVCQQYALDPFAENIILIDTGHAKLMTSYFNLADLRKVEGFENARFVDPYAGGKGNSIRYMSVGLRDENLRADEIENLFLGGEKSGFFVGHTEAITTGSLAGYNAAQVADGKPLLELPEELAVGDIISFANFMLGQEEGYKKRLTFAGGTYFQRMKDRQLYTTDVKIIRKRVEALGLTGIYNR